MAKRFTDTEKWDKAWFRKLSPKMKCVWFFLCDKCDHAGIWEIDLETMSHFVGQKTSLLEITNTFGVRVTVRENDKLFVESFVTFQYGNLNPENRAHKSVISKLEKLAPYKDLISPLGGAKDKDMDKVKVKVKEEESQLFDFEFVYNLYPKKEGKTKGIEFCQKNIKTKEDYDLLLKAVTRYSKNCRTERTERKFIKLFSSFMSVWKDYAYDDPVPIKYNPIVSVMPLPEEPHPGGKPLSDELKRLKDIALRRIPAKPHDEPPGAA